MRAETLVGLHVNRPLLWLDFNQNWNVFINFIKNQEYQISWKFIQRFSSFNRLLGVIINLTDNFSLRTSQRDTKICIKRIYTKPKPGLLNVVQMSGQKQQICCDGCLEHRNEPSRSIKGRHFVNHMISFSSSTLPNEVNSRVTN